jgi:hypothetical protein
MKHWILMSIFSMLFSYRIQAQALDSILINMKNRLEPCLPTNEINRHLGSDVYIYDEVIDFKIINDSLKLLYIGKKYPKQDVTILIEGVKLIKEVVFKKGDKWHFSGKAFVYKGKPAIIINNSVQLGTRIQI